MADTPSSRQTSCPPHQTDEIIIVGAGLAGLFLALNLAPRPTLVIAAKTLTEGASSHWAQGGIAAAIGEGDTPQAHATDTIKAGAGLVNQEVASSVAAEGADRILDLLEYGVPFDQDLEGRLALAKEAAHSQKRIVHVQGDKAGAAIMKALIKAVNQTPSIRVLEQTQVHKLEATNNKITALHLWPEAAKGQGPAIHLNANSIVLATGGVGHLYATTTNPDMARGEGIAMAARIGAVIRDPEFVQFHPTAIDVGQDPAPLATEALRGDGATLINNKGERFMLAAHEKAELAPRDIVARAVHQQHRQGQGAYLDCRGALAARMQHHYPTVLSHCHNAGIDPTKDPIPVAPAAHFHMGGIKTDEQGRSTIKGLWACGEVASTGLHGANRLASNSLLEAIVFAKRIAEDIKANTTSITTNQPTNPLTTEQIKANNKQSPSDLTSKRTTLRHLMAAHVAVERNETGLTETLNQLENLKQNVPHNQLFQNMCLTASLITHAALQRTKSCGSHFRTDGKSKDTMPEHTELTIQDIQSSQT